MHAKISLYPRASILISGENGLIYRVQLLGKPKYPPEIVDIETDGDSLFLRSVNAVVSYLKGENCSLASIPVELKGVTEFTREVLFYVRNNLKCGEVATYGQVARGIGKPGAARAVGQALKRNPIPILIPCHRVVSAHGLGGFSSGIDWKRFLLRIEGANFKDVR